MLTQSLPPILWLTSSSWHFFRMIFYFSHGIHPCVISPSTHTESFLHERAKLHRIVPSATDVALRLDEENLRCCGAFLIKILKIYWRILQFCTCDERFFYYTSFLRSSAFFMTSFTERVCTALYNLYPYIIWMVSCKSKISWHTR